MLDDHPEGMKWWTALILFMVISSVFLASFFHDKKTVGAVEDVVLMPWGIKLVARVDTGAATSSLSVKNILVTNGLAEFSIPDGKTEKNVRLPLLEWRTVKSSGGVEESRPVVEMGIQLAGKNVRSQVTLDDRSKMSYPMLIGRRTLKGRFVVDVAKNRSGASASTDGSRE